MNKDILKKEDIKSKKVKLIICDVLYDEIKDKIPQNWDLKNFEKRLHEHSDDLRNKLQEEINKSQEYDIILLGYGLCGKSIEGLVSPNTYLVIPKCDDCIAILLGSVEEYKRQFYKEPGTYYLTRGYLGDDEDFIVNGFSEIKHKYDKETWDWIAREMLKNYKRLAFINTKNYDPSQWRDKAREEAVKLGLRFEEIEGKSYFFDKLINCKWGHEFLILKPNVKVTQEMFVYKKYQNKVDVKK